MCNAPLPLYDSPLPLYNSPLAVDNALLPLHTSPSPLSNSPPPLYNALLPLYSSPLPLPSSPLPLHNSPLPGQVMASRHPRLLLRVHRFRDEVFFLLMLLVERQCVHTCQASMAEHLFSLIRAGPGGKAITPRQRRLSLVLLVVLPYVQRKMERLCESRLRVDGDSDEGEQLPDDRYAGIGRSLAPGCRSLPPCAQLFFV